MVTRKYIELAKMLDVEYEAKIFEKWQKENTSTAVDLLKLNILAKNKETKAYFVNF